MELTPVFNAVARDDGGQAPVDAGPELTGPSGGAAEIVDASADFGAEAAPRDAAQRELLEMLERGRATPYFENNSRPDRDVEQNVHTDVEFRREALIATVRAELSADQYQLEAEQDHDEGLEHAW